jgi:hypothetical protein
MVEHQEWIDHIQRGRWKRATDWESGAFDGMNGVDHPMDSAL